MRTALVRQAGAMGVRLSPEQAGQFMQYMEMLLARNETLNLTAITEPEDILEKHFLDSLSLLAHCRFKEGARVIDVGTGAGFPGIPLLIARPDLRMTLLDGHNKRLVFLREVCEALGLEAETVHRRAEEAGRDSALRERYDAAVARAVAPLPILCEYCIPLVKMKGLFLAMKGPGAKDELVGAERALSVLGAPDAELLTFSLPTAGERGIVKARKTGFTPREYPRHGNTIVKHSL